MSLEGLPVRIVVVELTSEKVGICSDFGKEIPKIRFGLLHKSYFNFVIQSRVSP